MAIPTRPSSSPLLPTLNTITTLYTVPSGKITEFGKLFVVNASTSTDGTFEVWSIPTGGTASNTNLLVPEQQVPLLEMVCVDLAGHVLTAGDFIQVRSKTQQLSFHLSVAEG
jgi:hypothetical protein